MDFTPTIKAIDQRIFELRFARKIVESLALQNGDTDITTFISPPALPTVDSQGPVEKSKVPSVSERPAFKKLKKKLGPRKKAAISPKIQEAIDYVTSHPNCTLTQAAADLKSNVGAVGFSFRKAKKLGHIVLAGTGRNCTWSVPGAKPVTSKPAQKTSAPKTTTDDPGEDKSGVWDCEECGKRFAEDEDLQKHIERRHL